MTIDHPIFDQAFTLFAYINEVETYDNGWLSVNATAGRFPGQTIATTQFPAQYSRYMDDILAKVAFPANITGRRQTEDTPFFASVAKLRFYRFHLRFHSAETYNDRYGVIDRMWDEYGHELKLSLPPQLEELVEKDRTAPPKAIASGENSAIAEEFQKFLSSKWSSTQWPSALANPLTPSPRR